MVALPQPTPAPPRGQRIVVERRSAPQTTDTPAVFDCEEVEVYYSSAVPAGNPEREAARRRGLAERPRAALLAELSALRRTIAVAGTHGAAPEPRWPRLTLAIGLPAVLVAGLAAAGLAAAGVFGGGTTPRATPTPQATVAPPVAQPHAVATIKVGKGPDGVAASQGRVFVSNFDAGTISEIDPKTNRQSAVVPAGTRPQGVVAGKGRLPSLTRTSIVEMIRSIASRIGNRPE